MTTIRIKIWDHGKIVAETLMNSEGRLDFNFIPMMNVGKYPDRITIEPDDPNSKVQFTHYGGKYTP